LYLSNELLGNLGDNCDISGQIMATHMSSILLVTAKKTLLFLVWRRREGWGFLASCHIQHKQASSIANCLDSLKGREEKVVAFYTLYLSLGFITKKPEWFISLLHTVGVQVLGAFDDVLYITYYAHVPPYKQRLNVPISSYFTTNLLAFNSHPHVTTMQTQAKDESQQQ
jgi:hypothetical protein